MRCCVWKVSVKGLPHVPLHASLEVNPTVFDGACSQERGQPRSGQFVTTPDAPCKPFVCCSKYLHPAFPSCIQGIPIGVTIKNEKERKQQMAHILKARAITHKPALIAKVTLEYTVFTWHLLNAARGYGQPVYHFCFYVCIYCEYLCTTFQQQQKTTGQFTDKTK